ncbi:MAG: TAT-variant-translocated molybdopterin oxidoreductase [Chthoniobacterales bacterium]
MKRIFNHPPREQRPKMWRTLGELENSPEFEEVLKREFPEGAGLYTDAKEGGLSRRDFLRLMGASAALAGVGLAGCRRPEAFLVPFKNNNEWTIPGKFLYYSTAMPTRTGVMPLIATTVDGRPTKLEGNPLHPESTGGTNGFAQASILDLYDPYRAKTFIHNKEQSSPEAFTSALNDIRTSHQKDGGAGLAFLVERTDSPTRDRLRQEIFRQFPKATWVEYEALNNVNAPRSAAAAFGPGVRVLPRFDRADVIVALDSDFLNSGEVGIGFSRGFHARRNPDQGGAPMNRLYVVESSYTLTGGMADHRLRAKTAAIPAVAVALAKQIAEKTSNSDLAALVSAYPSPEGEFDAVWVKECANDLLSARGRSLVLTRAQQSVELQTLIHGINEALGNNGTVVEGLALPAPQPSATIEELTDILKAGRITSLFILGGNPVYNAPANLNFGELLKDTLANTVRLGFFEDETSQYSKWNVPGTHYLETWGDGRSLEGVYSIIQPMVLPLYGGWSDLDILAQLAGVAKPEGSELVQQTFKQLFPTGDFATAWNSALRTGFVDKSAFPASPTAFNAASASAIVAKAQPLSTKGFELVFTSSSSVDDGRYANNSWLQETPDFITKITWDNAALLSPATAKRLGFKIDEDDQLAPFLEISKGGKTVKIPAFIAPGQADDSVSVALGYGRDKVSHLMQGVGFDIYPLRGSDSMRVLPEVDVKVVGGTYHFAVQQGHSSMEGRDLAREGTIEKYKANPTFAQTMGMDGHIPENISLYTNPPLTSPEQWAMTVDLNSCNGCNACIVACQAENNVPVVGKDQVIRGRHMGWIRLDRWFAGDEHNPEMLAQAVMCQHCENAPCETVCPVNATVHSEDGLNLMAYNRCIGTRYCANNCPWKVRRFNYFDYNQRPTDELYYGPIAKKGMADSLKMSKNPNVTVRMRGVMEKCTFCIQRIEEAKIGRLVEAGPTDKNNVRIGEFKVACQQACPSDAIVFGNENDPNSRVARLRKSERGYVMLKYLNTRPRITYLARIKNPNPRMPDADKVGHINTEGHGAHHPAGEGHADPHGAESGHEAAPATNGHPNPHGGHAG